MIIKHIFCKTNINEISDAKNVVEINIKSFKKSTHNLPYFLSCTSF